MEAEIVIITVTPLGVNESLLLISILKYTMGIFAVTKFLKFNFKYTYLWFRFEPQMATERAKFPKAPWSWNMSKLKLHPSSLNPILQIHISYTGMKQMNSTASVKTEGMTDKSTVSNDFCAVFSAKCLNLVNSLIAQ